MIICMIYVSDVLNKLTTCKDVVKSKGEAKSEGHGHYFWIQYAEVKDATMRQSIVCSLFVGL